MNNFHAIYRITNTHNNKIYIGSAVNYGKRMSSHLLTLRKGIHRNIYLQRSFIKYGEVFIFDVLEKVTNKKDLIEREQYYIDTLNPDYNICKVAGSILGFKFSEESKKKLSEMRRGDKHPNFGKPMLEETKEKLSIKAKERMDVDRKVMHRNFHLSRMKVVIQSDLNGNFIKEFQCIRDVTRETGFNRAFISRCCSGYHKQAYNYTWEFKKTIIG